MIGRLAPTGMKPAPPPSRDELERADNEAWAAYDAACWDPYATPDDRSKAFGVARETLLALLRFDQQARGHA